MFFFVFGWSGGNEAGLRQDFFKFMEFERAVVAGRLHAEAVVDEVLLARCVAFVHAADLGFVHVVFRSIHMMVDFSFRLSPFLVVGFSSRSFMREKCGVIFDAFAEAHFVEHFEVKAGALFDALLFDGTVFFDKEINAFT